MILERMLLSGAVLLLVNILHVNGQCQDLDSQACVDLHKGTPGLCSEPIGQQICAKFCGLCAVTCYHCPDIVANYTDCDSVKTCTLGQRCFLAEVHENSGTAYKMSCVEPERCSGAGILGIVGRRRSLTLTSQCCDEDRCNYPPNFTTTSAPTELTTTVPRTTTQTDRTTSTVPPTTMTYTTPTTMTTTTIIPTTTAKPTCSRDIQFMIEDNENMDRTDTGNIKQFLTTFVKTIDIGQQDNHVDVALMGGRRIENAGETWHQTQGELLHQITAMNWHLHEDQVEYNDIIHFFTEHHRTDIQNGRNDIDNVIIFIVDQNSNLHVDAHLGPHHGDHGEQQDLSAVSQNIIVLDVGSSATAGGFTKVATSPSNVINVSGFDDLNTIIPQLLQAICK